MSMRTSGIPNWTSALLLLVLWNGLSRGAKEKTVLTPELLSRVSNVIQTSDTLLCFTMQLEDLACFWESQKENASYKFSYQVENNEEDTKECKLSTEVATNITWWHICDFPILDVAMFLSINISVTETENRTTILYNRVISVDEMVFLEPPTNVTVKEKLEPWGLLVSWVMPSKPLEGRIKYQIAYSAKESDTQMVEFDSEKTVIFLTEISAVTQYTIQVRARGWDQSWSGYWSEWSEPITIQTSTKGWSLLHILLFFIVTPLLLITIVCLVLSHRRFLKQKVWPQVPRPDSLFQGLFTTHKGNFKLWLGQADLYIVWISRHFFHEEPSSSLEVLSELIPAPTLPHSTVQLPPKDGYVTLDKNLVPHFPAWTEALARDAPSGHNLEQGPWIEPPHRDIRQEGHAWVGTPGTETSLEEILTEENDSARSLKNEAITLKVSREASVSSDEGMQSLTSSFEYTVVDTCEGLLSPKPHPTAPQSSMKYAYFLMSDLKNQNLPPPPPQNHYQNSLCTHLPNPVYSQC